MKAPMQSIKPWYRHPWPWILAAGPATVVVASLFTAWLAVRSSDGLVDDDYYKQGLAVNQRMARDHAAAERGLTAELVVGANAEDLRLFLSARDAAVLPDALQFRVIHPTRSGADQMVVLKRDAQGFYVGRLGSPLRGRWHVSLEDAAEQWRLTGDWNVDRQPTLRLVAIATTSNKQGS